MYLRRAVDMPQLQVLELMRLGVRMLPRTVSRLGSLTRLSFSGEMMRSVQLQDDLLQLTDLKVGRQHAAVHEGCSSCEMVCWTTVTCCVGRRSSTSSGAQRRCCA